MVLNVEVTMRMASPVSRPRRAPKPAVMRVFTEARGVETHRDDGRGDEPEEREQRYGRKREREHSEGCSDGSCEARDLDGAAPDDGIAGKAWRNGLLCKRVRGGLLRDELLINLFA